MSGHASRPPSGSPPAVIFDRASYRAPGGPRILDRLSFAVAGREVVALVGASGAGKTTALQLVNRLLEPTAGEVRVEGRSTLDWDPVELRRRIGYVIQEIGLFPHMSVARNVGLVPELSGWERDLREERIAAMLDLVGLPVDEYGGRPPSRLSGGQRQRVGVARALAADPPLLLLDEPFGALDPVTRLDLQREFRQIVGDLGKAALFVTHDLREAMAVADRIGLVDGGRLAFIGTPAAFLVAEDSRVKGFVATLGATPGEPA